MAEKERTIIETRGLTKRYGEFTAVDSLDLSINQGEVFGLLGPNGAGKTTTTLMLLGLTEPTEGEAFIDGKNCTRDPIAVKSIVGYLPDNVGFYPDLTGRQNLRFTGELNGLGKEECEERIEALLERVGMTYAADKKVSTYSRGMRQRLGIADVLMKDPKVIIMDEPTLGIDPEGMRVLMALITELAEVDGRTILISSHQLYQVQQVCHRVGIFVKGKLIACGRREDLGKQLQAEGMFSVEITAEPLDNAQIELIKSVEGVAGVEKNAEGMLRIDSERDVRHDVLNKLHDAGYDVIQLRKSGDDLHEIYRRYFEKAGESDGAAKEKRKSGKRASDK